MNKTLDIEKTPYLASKKGRVLRITACVLLFFIFFIFYSCAHPVVMWCGDDWYSLCNWGDSYIFFDMTTEFTTSLPSSLLGTALGKLSGYIAAFIVYPLTDDYIGSLIVSDAILTSICICITIMAVYKLIQTMSNNNWMPVVGVMLYITAAFTFFKAVNPGQHLYWSYNRCALFLYSIPTWLGSSLILYLMRRRTLSMPFGMDLTTGILIACWYILTFSHFMISVLLTTFSGLILIWDLVKYKSIKSLCKKDWFYIAATMCFPLKLYIELKRTFSIGYLGSSGSFGAGIKESFRRLWCSFGDMHILFKFMAVVGIVVILCMACFHAMKKKPREVDNKRWIEVFAVFVMQTVVQFVFFVLFGAVSLGHVAVLANQGMRFDTCFGLYFFVVLIVVLIWIYILCNYQQVIICVPVMILMMLCVAIDPTNAYSESYFLDTTSAQKYEISSAIVREVIEHDKKGEYSLTVHMPPYQHFSGFGMTAALCYHNLTNGYVIVNTEYDAQPGEIWFE